jgi:hypothetical protein
MQHLLQAEAQAHGPHVVLDTESKDVTSQSASVNNGTVTPCDMRSNVTHFASSCFFNLVRNSAFQSAKETAIY